MVCNTTSFLGESELKVYILENKLVFEDEDVEFLKKLKSDIFELKIIERCNR